MLLTVLAQNIIFRKIGKQIRMPTISHHRSKDVYGTVRISTSTASPDSGALDLLIGFGFRSAA
jgi:hypothetical protein